MSEEIAVALSDTFINLNSDVLNQEVRPDTRHIVLKVYFRLLVKV